MIVPPTLVFVRARVMQLLGALVLLVLALVAVPTAFAGDRLPPETRILTGPASVTSSTTADFTFESTATRAEFFCWLESNGTVGAEFDCGTPWHLEGLAPGDHVLWVYSVDLDLELADQTPEFWEWTVVAGEPVDAGVPGSDAGTDGGPSGDEDAGTVDSGTPGGEDAGTPGGEPDAGAEQPGPPPTEDPAPPSVLDYLGGGVGCTGAPAPGALTGLVLLVLALHRRRRR
ncbi:hypothetical protein HPC49_33995 [Pyxidicoccus fallax]|uniref:MYXO-CTERM domain-containing protein n=1 Tax=Pyxidicoccus fallax TaxID=394095 RepID=A0A848LSF0_9BACT|nr:MYXO-CTERM sorting domain-containing protein [Pyxidicoccus fallax]NMO20589.1 hypothetical protein [Pyxidicoccus fallax]NPC83220.1 hypothetical protein [Pyxidicoccus fallax]